MEEYKINHLQVADIANEKIHDIVKRVDKCKSMQEVEDTCQQLPKLFQGIVEQVNKAWDNHDMDFPTLLGLLTCIGGMMYHGGKAVNAKCAEFALEELKKLFFSSKEEEEEDE